METSKESSECKILFVNPLFPKTGASSTNDSDGGGGSYDSEDEEENSISAGDSSSKLSSLLILRYTVFCKFALKKFNSLFTVLCQFDGCEPFVL